MRAPLFANLIALLTAPAVAQPATALDARAAQAIVAGCVAHSTTKQQSHAIAVVDSGGHLVAALRMDGNGSGIFDFALAKAQAAAAWLGASMAARASASLLSRVFSVVLATTGLAMLHSAMGA